MPEPGRVFRARDGHLPPARQRLHAGVRLLRHRQRQAARRGPARAGARPGGGGGHGAPFRGPHVGRSRRPRRRRRGAFRRHDRGAAVARARPGHRGPDSRLSRTVRLAAGRRRGPAGRLQPQRRDGAPSLRAGPPRGAPGPVARTALRGEDPGPFPDHEIGAHARPRRARRRSARAAREAARGRGGHRHDRPVPAAVARKPAGRRIRADRRRSSGTASSGRSSGFATCSRAPSCAPRTGPKRPCSPPAARDRPLAHAAFRRRVGPALRAGVSPGRVGPAAAARAGAVARRPAAGREPLPGRSGPASSSDWRTGARRSRGSSTSSPTTAGRAPRWASCAS